MGRVTTNDLYDKNICTYMEALKATRDKLNEVIDVINRSNLVPLYHYNIWLEIETDTSYVCFDIYSHIEVDHNNIVEFLENYQEDFDVVSNGVYNDEAIFCVAYRKETERLSLYSDGSVYNINPNDIADSTITFKEVK